MWRGLRPPARVSGGTCGDLAGCLGPQGTRPPLGSCSFPRAWPRPLRGGRGALNRWDPAWQTRASPPPCPHGRGPSDRAVQPTGDGQASTRPPPRANTHRHEEQAVHGEGGVAGVEGQPGGRGEASGVAGGPAPVPLGVGRGGGGHCTEPLGWAASQRAPSHPPSRGRHRRPGRITHACACAAATLGPVPPAGRARQRLLRNT